MESNSEGGAPSQEPNIPVSQANAEEESQPKHTEERDQETEVMEIDLSQSQAANKNSGSSNSKVNGDKEGEDEDEGGDEPDAMSMSQQSLDKLDNGHDSRKLYNGYTDSPSGEEDVEEDDRLVIDDANEEGVSKSLTKAKGQLHDRIYSCPKCDVVTISPKAYLYHLDTAHKAKDNAKNSNSFHQSESVSDSSLINQPNRSDFLNFSLPLKDQSSSMAVDEEEEEEEELRGSSHLTLNLASHPATMPMTITADNIDKIFEDDKKKKKKTRQEVDPGKYFEAVDSSGTKYACSQCGNIYKWRKSLNKHWKEKHLHDPLIEVASPPGMLELLKSGKYTQLGSRRIYDNTFLQTIKTQKEDNASQRSTPNTLSNSPSPPSFLNSSQILNTNAARLVASMASTIPSKMIGPFVANGTQPVFPGMGLTVPHLPLQNGYDTSMEEAALDLTRDSKNESSYSPFPAGAAKLDMNPAKPDMNTSLDQDQPLDFSKKREDNVPVKPEKLWEEINSNLKHSQGVNQFIPKLHQCSKCDYTSTSESDFAAHTGSHYNKRMVKCFECKIQLNSMEDLNSHFLNDHHKKLTEYKEAIKKIPHGLQQTYHLLKMDLQSIGELNNQDLGSSDSKSLKCKKCDFEAKWPAELQKHAVSHSEERPYICMVCGSTYKWKWDLVKHFQKSHPTLPNPYRRNDKRDTPDGSSEDDLEEEPDAKKAKMASTEAAIGHLYNADDAISVEGIIAATQAGQRFVSSQPNLLDSDPSLEQSLAFVQNYVGTGSAGLAFTSEMAARHAKAQKAVQENAKSHQTTPLKKANLPELSTSPMPANSKNEQLPYKCTMCNYHARWPSEITQHMKNHSDSKPYLCPRCDYRSKWKWDVVKHLKRCGGGTINDVIDTTKMRKKDLSNCGPPNAIVSQQGKVKKMTPQTLSFLPTINANGEPGAYVFHPPSLESPSVPPFMMQDESERPHGNDMSADQYGEESDQSNDSDLIDLTTANNNNDDSNVNNDSNNFAIFSSSQSGNASSSSLLSMSTINTTLESVGNVVSNAGPVHHSTPIAMAGNNGSTSRQNTSAEIWDCPHCAFSTHSQAELKRHSGLHKDDKPFKCDECNYSTRWACDLKKHRKSYDHYPKRSNQFLNSKDIARNLKGQQSQKSEEKPSKPTESKGRFKCFQCSTYFISLQDLMDHRKSSHAVTDTLASSSSSETMTNHEIDVARIKHPRKLIKQLSCPKCPFLCKTRMTMDKHMEEHEQMERNALHCFYCSSQFKDKESLLDHIVTHPAFNPKEWETFFMISEEEEQPLLREENGEESRVSPHSGLSDSDKKDGYAKSASEAATQARIQQILNEIPKQNVAQAQTSAAQAQTGSAQAQTGSAQAQTLAATSSKKFQCEWCPAQFSNLTAVYKHASQDHPVQLKEQDTTQSSANEHLKSHDHHQKHSETEEKLIRKLRQQIQEKRQQHMAEKLTHQHLAENFTEQDLREQVMTLYEQNVKQSMQKNSEEDSGMKELNGCIEDSVGAHTYLCDKCNFSSPNQSTFELHYKLHGSKRQSQCWFCDYSIDRVELLYQHMKISHIRKWKALASDAKYASQVQRLNFLFGNSNSYGNNNDSPPGHSPTLTSNDGMAMDLSSKRSSVETSHDIVYITKQQYTWSGVPVNVVMGDSLNFVCPMCSFTGASIDLTCTHVMQNHDNALAKFNCKQCSFSDNNIHVVSDHCKMTHPGPQRVIEVIEFKQLSYLDFQRFKNHLKGEKLPKVLNKLTNAKRLMLSPEGKEVQAKSLSCPFCPFRSASKESMKEHIVYHNSDSRFRCEQCDFSVDSPSTMTDHVKVHSANYKEGQVTLHMPNPSVQEEKKSLNEAFSQQYSNVKDQLDAASNNKDLFKSASPKCKTAGRIRYRCSVCPYHTTCKSNIFKHKRQHLIPKRYKCPKCSYSAARAVLLRNHIESHSVPVEDDGYYHDIFYDPNTSNDKNDDVEDPENEMEEGDDEGSSTSDDLENEMDTKAIADLEAKDILEAEAVYKATMLIEGEANSENTFEKQFRKQKCLHCPFSSNSAYEFRKHVHFHGTQERYKCDHCNYSIDRLNLLTQHRKLHMDEPNFSINPQASDLLNTSFILQQNQMAAASEGKVCEETGGEENSSSQFCCSHCPYRVSCKKSFDIHTSSHGQRKRYICDFCDWSSERFALLNHHRKLHEKHPTFQANLDEKNFLNQEFDDGKSGEFEAKFMEIPNVDKPAQTGEAEGAKSPPFKLTVIKKSYPCKLCPYKTNSKSSYQFHKGMHGAHSQFLCSHCDFAAINRGVLQQHVLLHSPTTSSESSQQVLPYTSSHTDHSEGDESMEPVSDQTRGGNPLGDSTKTDCSLVGELTCERCPFTATSAASLSEHMKCHSLQEKLVCPYCDFGATSREVMFPHIQIHFPGTKLEASALERMIEEHSGKNNNNNNNDIESSLNLSKNPGNATNMPAVKENKVIKTKIYVCQYCEREFEAKSLMIQHEKQHLVGSHVE